MPIITVKMLNIVQMSKKALLEKVSEVVTETAGAPFFIEFGLTKIPPLSIRSLRKQKKGV